MPTKRAGNLTDARLAAALAVGWAGCASPPSHGPDGGSDAAAVRDDAVGGGGDSGSVDPTCAAGDPIVVDLATQPAPVIEEGRAYRFVRGGAAVTLVLAPGSAGTLDASGVYHAPAHVPVAQAIAGCQLLPNDAVYNVRVDGLPLAPQTSAWTSSANVGTVPLSFLPSWGTNLADATTPVVTMRFNYTSTANGPWVFPARPRLEREGGALQSPTNGHDHHVQTVRRDTCEVYETYNDHLAPYACRDGSAGCTAQSGLHYAAMTYDLATDGATDAANLPLAPLTWRAAEIRAGQIHHAVRFTLAGGYVQAPTTPLWPSTSINGGCAHCAANPPYGTRYRLEAGYDVSHFSPTAHTLLVALQQYGMFLADAGTGPALVVDADATTDPVINAAFGEIAAARLHMTDFEVVDESALMVSPTSSRVDPANAVAHPDVFAVLTVTPGGGGTPATVPLALEGVTVGVPAPRITVLAGTPGYRLTAWVHGACDTGVTWSLASGAGSVTADGVYTAPTGLTAAQSAVLVATSHADPLATIDVAVSVLPDRVTPAGSIRIDSGNPIMAYTDANGAVWQPDQAFQTGVFRQLASDYPTWPETTNPELGVYESQIYTYGDDLTYRFVVPNGNYRVRLMFGGLYDGCTQPCGPFDATYKAPLDLEAQGQVAAHGYDWGLSSAYADAMPTDIAIPAQVTDQTLYIAMRGLAPEGSTQQPGPALNGLEITGDATAPYLAIDTGQRTSLVPGATWPLYAVGWYMSNAVTWSVAGGGTIDATTGVYTAPATAPAAPVTVTATSTTSPGVRATASFAIMP